MNKAYQANVLALTLHVGKYRVKLFFGCKTSGKISPKSQVCLKTQSIFLSKIRLHVFGIGIDINFEGKCSCASSKTRKRQSHGLTNGCFLARPRPINVCYFSASAAGSSEENFSDSADVHLENSNLASPQGSSGSAKLPQTP